MRKILLALCWMMSAVLNAQDVELILPLGHAEGIQSVEYSGNGKYILTKGYDNTSVLWNTSTGKLIYQISSPDYIITYANFIGDGERLATICSDGKIRILKTSTVELLITIPNIRTDLCRPVFSKGGNFVLGLDSKNFISVWKTTDGSKVNTFDKLDGSKYYAQWSSPTSNDPEGAQFMGVWKRTSSGIFFIDRLEKETIYTSSTVEFIGRSDFNQEIGYFITKTKDQVSFWNIQSGDSLFTFGDNNRHVVDVYVNQKAGNFLLEYDDATLELRNNKNGSLIQTHTDYKSAALYSKKMVYSSDGSQYYISSHSKGLSVFESATGKLLKEFKTIPKDDGILMLNAEVTTAGKLYLVQSEGPFFYDPKICLYDLETEKKILEVKTKKGSSQIVKFSPNGKEILVEYSGRVEIWDIQKAKRKFVLEGQTVNMSRFNFRTNELPDEFSKEILTVCEDSVARIIDLVNLNISKKFVGHKDKLYEAIYSPDSKYVITGGGAKQYDSHWEPENVIKIWSLQTGKQVDELKGHESAVYSMDFNSNGKQLASLDNRGGWRIWNFENKKLMKSDKIHGFMNKIVFHPSDTLVGIANNDGRLEMRGIRKGSEYKSKYVFFDHVNDLNFNKQGSEILACGSYSPSGSAVWVNVSNDSTLYLGKSYVDSTSGRRSYHKGIESTINTIAFNKDETRFLTANSNRKSELWDLSGKRIAELKSHTDDVQMAKFTPDYKQIITCAEDNMVKIWDAETGKEKVSIVLFKNEDVLTFTPDKYYFANKNIVRQLSWKKGGDFYSFDQFDLKFNRPDVVLGRLGYADDKLIKAYHQAYLKRLKKMNFTEEMLKDDFHLPEVKIENFEFIPEITDEDSLSLNLNLYDSKYPLDRINIYINDVPLFGVAGVDLRQFNTKEYKTNVAVKLAEGENNIQVSVLNQAGAESYKQRFEVISNRKAEKHDLYLLCIGVSKYQDSAFNLSYADKDAKDISTLYSTSKNYDKVHVKTLLNEEVTLENVLAAKTFVQQAGRNDEVMVFVAGHGVLDKNFDYYFASYDMDFSDPSQKGIPYDKVEGLLDGISPLKKVMLIDACHSGEVDKDELELASVATKESGSVKFRKVGNGVQPRLGSDNSFELVKSLFTDLRKGTGTTVISSAGGLEFAMESGSWKNGLFTYCLMNGIKSKTADLNKDGNIMLSELQQYLQNEVSKLSGGNQQPTSRFENLQGDFKVW